MPLFGEKLGFIYFFAPGTGSSAVGHALVKHRLGDWLLPEDSELDRKHASPRELINHGYLQKSDSSKYLFVVNLRNPFDWYVSDYIRWSRKWPLIYRQGFVDNPDHEEAKRVYGWLNSKNSQKSLQMAKDNSFAGWLSSMLQARKPHEFQGDYHHDNTVYLRQESLSEDFERLSTRLGFPKGIELEQWNVTEERDRERSYRDYYTDDLIDLVYAKNRPFFERFDYAF